ncbi:hypothetical protein BGZ61DRAFT_513436 [Ilyonectria robusta]|uniref:uncharacterized protein n=1 Tax=Ilyonectria robusta TaxID=1079257 RepID=UPI001E8E31DF|nr:uncharacterized protein BGZ61DRAFT_513436 [Ilyonectria robusta]KAH8736179.1 hypothetical protein BGZ61DRAFT_513436 [Ilyonectria robusta]
MPGGTEEREAREARFGGMQDEVTPRSGAERRKTDTAEVGGVGREDGGGWRGASDGRWAVGGGGGRQDDDDGDAMAMAMLRLRMRHASYTGHTRCSSFLSSPCLCVRGASYVRGVRASGLGALGEHSVARTRQEREAGRRTPNPVGWMSARWLADGLTRDRVHYVNNRPARRGELDARTVPQSVDLAWISCTP